MDIINASRKLSELDLQITVDNLRIEVLWFRAMENKGDWCINRHMHSTYEFHFIRCGSCKVILDTSEFIVQEGEFYLTAPGVYHQQMTTSEEQCVEYCINCDLKLIEDKVSEVLHILNILKTAPCQSFKDTFGAIKLFDRALEEANGQSIGFYNNIKSVIMMIITSAARAMNEIVELKYEVPIKNREEDFRLLEIEKFIEDNIFDAMSTGDIAKYMHLSEKQICRIIEKARGISTKEMMIHKKLQKAKQLLKDTNLSIKEISNMLAFTSEYYFNQFFKREEGYPPGIYRKNVKSIS